MQLKPATRPLKDTAMLTFKQVSTALSATDTKFLRLDKLCEACGVTPSPENLHKVLKATRNMEASARDMFDLGVLTAPMVVPYRGSKAIHDIEFDRADLPDDPSVQTRKSAEERKSAPQKNLMPAIRLVSATDWDRYTENEALKESLRTGVLKTLANLPDAHRVCFGDVKSVAVSPTEGWAMVTMLVKVS